MNPQAMRGPWHIYNASGVMTGEELDNLEDSLLFHRSHDLERQVREQAARCAASCLDSGQPWRCCFMEPLVFRAKAEPAERALSVISNEVTVDVRGVHDLFAATLLAEEQIRRQLAKLPWAKLPDLAASR